MVKFYAWTSLHLVFKCSKFVSLGSIAWTKMCFLSCSILWMSLAAKSRSSIVGLISIWTLSIISCSSGFWQSPSGEVLFFRWICACFRYISAGTNTIWSRSLIFKSLSSSVTESIFFCMFVYRFFFREVLRSWILFKISTLKPWLCSNFRS